MDNKKKMEEQKYNQFNEARSLMGSAVNFSEPSIYNVSQSTSRVNDLQDSRLLTPKNPPQLANQFSPDNKEPDLLLVNNKTQIINNSSK
jgi:hypothetical protein